MSQNQKIYKTPSLLTKQGVAGVITYNISNDLESSQSIYDNATFVKSMHEYGLDRNTRKQEIEKCFDVKTGSSVRVIETLVNKTTGLDQDQLSSLLGYIKCKNILGTEKFLESLDQKVEDVWLKKD